MPLFRRFFQAGRLAIGRYGDVFDKPVIIVEIQDLHKVIIDGPGIQRQLISTKRLALTDFKLDIERGASTETVMEALKSNNVIVQWKKTKWGEKRERFNKRRNLNDFERFKLIQARTALANAN